MFQANQIPCMHLRVFPPRKLEIQKNKNKKNYNKKANKIISTCAFLLSEFIIKWNNKVDLMSQFIYLILCCYFYINIRTRFYFSLCFCCRHFIQPPVVCTKYEIKRGAHKIKGVPNITLLYLILLMFSSVLVRLYFWLLYCLKSTIA